MLNTIALYLLRHDDDAEIFAQINLQAVDGNKSINIRQFGNQQNNWVGKPYYVNGVYTYQMFYRFNFYRFNVFLDQAS